MYVGWDRLQRAGAAAGVVRVQCRGVVAAAGLRACKGLWQRQRGAVRGNNTSTMRAAAAAAAAAMVALAAADSAVIMQAAAWEASGGVRYGGGR